MQMLKTAYELAKDRGYFHYPKVVALQDHIPAWFQGLGDPAGLARFEAHRGVRVPAALREFYSSSLLACFLEASIDGEVFLSDLISMTGAEPPPIVWWSAKPHLVFAFHCHSGSVCAAELCQEDPQVFWGTDDAASPFGDERPPPIFSEWVFRAVDGYDAVLDYWQAVYLRCQADPAEALRLGGAAWVRDMPGMAERLGQV